MQAPTAAAATEADVPIDLPGPPCTDPSGRALTVLVVRPPEHGTLAGWRYTPAAGFAGQDAMTYRVTNGVSESELIRLSIPLVTRRPVPAARRSRARRRWRRRRS